MSIGKRIHQIRSTLKLKQEDFAKQIIISRPMISYYEKDEKLPSAAIIKNICREFYISEEWLLNGTGEMLDQERIAEEEASKEKLLWMADELEKSFHSLSMYMKDFEMDHQTTILYAFDELIPILMKSMNDPNLLFEYHDEVTVTISETSRFIKYMYEIVNGNEYTDKLAKYNAYRNGLANFYISFNSSCDKIFETVYSDYESSKLSSIIEETSSVIKESPTPYQVEIVGNVAAGKPISLYNQVGDLIDVPGSKTVDYALSIKGDSMEPKINNGSIVFVKQQDDLDQGEIGIFLIDDENVTCKRYIRNNGTVILRSENDMYEDLVFGPESNIRILGKVVQTVYE